MILATLAQWCASCADADQIGVGLGILTGAGGAVTATGALGGILSGAVDPGNLTSGTPSQTTNPDNTVGRTGADGVEGTDGGS